MPAPRVLFVNHSSRLSGAELVLLDVVGAFDRPGVLLFEDGPLRAAIAETGAVPVVLQGSSSFSGVKRDRSLLRSLPHLGGMARMVLRLARLARRFDVVYANSQKAFVLAAAACPLARRPLVWHLHDILTRAHFGRAQIALTIRLANSVASRVLVPSQAAADAFLGAGGRADLLRIVPNGLEDVPVEPVARASLELGTPFIFGVFSRLSPWKGQEVALDALAHLPDAGCIIAGGALFGEEDYAAGLVRRAERLQVTERVRFLGHRTDIPALMRAVDAVVHPSTEPEPFGRTLVEAMLARRPLVAAAAGAVPEILDGGRFGLMVPPGDPEALAAGLRRVRNGEANAMLDPALDRARTLYDVSRMRASIHAAVIDLVSR